MGKEIKLLFLLVPLPWMLSNRHVRYAIKKLQKDRRLLQDKTKIKIIGSSTQRNYSQFIEDRGKSIFVHNCYKSYTRKENIEKAITPKTNQGDQPTRKPRLPLITRHCLICSEELDFAYYKRHPDRSSGIIEVELMDTQKRCILQETLLKAFERRTDELSLNVKARIHTVGDIPAVEAKYHRKCVQTFSGLERVSNENSDACDANEKAFVTLCHWLRSDDSDSQYILRCSKKLQIFLWCCKKLRLQSTSNRK